MGVTIVLFFHKTLSLKTLAVSLSEVVRMCRLETYALCYLALSDVRYDGA